MNIFATDHPLACEVPDRKSRSSDVLRSLGFALGFEALLVLAFFLFPWFPEGSGGGSQGGYAILILHYPFMRILASAFPVNFVTEVLLGVILAVVSWTIVFYGLWRFLSKRKNP